MPRKNLTYEEATQGRNPRRKKRQSTPELLFSGWANYNMTDADKEEFEVWERGEGVSELVDALLLKAEFKITVSYNDEQECFLATAFCRDEVSPNAGRMTSQRSQSTFRALFKLAWCIAFRMREDWSMLMSATLNNW